MLDKNRAESELVEYANEKKKMESALLDMQDQIVQVWMLPFPSLLEQQFFVILISVN